MVIHIGRVYMKGSVYREVQQQHQHQHQRKPTQQHQLNMLHSTTKDSPDHRDSPNLAVQQSESAHASKVVRPAMVGLDASDDEDKNSVFSSESANSSSEYTDMPMSRLQNATAQSYGLDQASGQVRKIVIDSNDTALRDGERAQYNIQRLQNSSMGLSSNNKKRKASDQIAPILNVTKGRRASRRKAGSSRSDSESGSPDGSITTRCPKCFKMYRQNNSLYKHLYEHHPHWMSVAEEFRLSKHQQVMLMQSAELLLSIRFPKRGLLTPLVRF